MASVLDAGMSAAFMRASRISVGDADRLREAAGRAWQTTLDAVDDSGLLTGVSAAVYSSTVASHYYHVPRGSDVAWGHGALLVAAAEMAAEHREVR